MVKNIEKPTPRDPHKAWIVQKVADMHGVSTRHVYLVLNGDRENEEILEAYMAILEGSNELVESVKTLIPFK